MRRTAWQTVWMAALVALLLVPVMGCGFVTKATTTSDCGNFLHNPNDCTTTTGTGTSSGSTDLAFVANVGSNTVTGFGISTTGTLAALSGSPINFSTQPLAMAVSRNNGFLYVGTASQIFGFSLSSTGAIAALNGGGALTNAFCVDMQTTPDGKYLMVLDGSGSAIDLFAIGSDGSLSATGSGGIEFTAAGSSVPRALRINAAGTVVAAALGSAGELLFSFNSSTATFTQLGSQVVPPSLTSDYGIAWDPTGGYLFIARTGSAAGLVVEQLASNGTLTPTTSAVYPTGSNPYAVTLDTAGKYAYVANHGDSTISAFAVGTGEALTAATGSPFASGSGVSMLGVEATGKFLLAVAPGGTPDLSVYSFDGTTAGKLDAAATSSTGTTAAFLALSH